MFPLQDTFLWVEPPASPRQQEQDAFAALCRAVNRRSSGPAPPASQRLLRQHSVTSSVPAGSPAIVLSSARATRRRSSLYNSRSSIGSLVSTAMQLGVGTCSSRRSSMHADPRVSPELLSAVCRMSLAAPSAPGGLHHASPSPNQPQSVSRCAPHGNVPPQQSGVWGALADAARLSAAASQHTSRLLQSGRLQQNSGPLQQLRGQPPQAHALETVAASPRSFTHIARCSHLAHQQGPSTPSHRGFGMLSQLMMQAGGSKDGGRRSRSASQARYEEAQLAGTSPPAAAHDVMHAAGTSPPPAAHNMLLEQLMHAGRSQATAAREPSEQWDPAGDMEMA